MGRPKKADPGAVSTRERILAAATELFAERGFEAVSIRDIAGACGLNESSLYNHFSGKNDLFTAVFMSLQERMIEPGFAGALGVASENDSRKEGLAALLLEGGKRFFSYADEDMLRIWRILVSGQFRFPEARDGVRKQLLDGPRRFFSHLLRTLRDSGRIRVDADCDIAAGCIAAIFFDFSFRSNLGLAWNDTAPDAARQLRQSLELVTAGLEVKKPEKRLGDVFRIRKAEAGDLEGIAALCYQMADFRAKLDPLFARAAEARDKHVSFAAACLADPDRCVLVGEQGEELIGYLFMETSVLPVVCAGYGVASITERKPNDGRAPAKLVELTARS